MNRRDQIIYTIPARNEWDTFRVGWVGYKYQEKRTQGERKQPMLEVKKSEIINHFH